MPLFLRTPLKFTISRDNLRWMYLPKINPSIFLSNKITNINSNRLFINNNGVELNSSYKTRRLGISNRCIIITELQIWVNFNNSILKLSNYTSSRINWITHISKLMLSNRHLNNNSQLLNNKISIMKNLIKEILSEWLKLKTVFLFAMNSVLK